MTNGIGLAVLIIGGIVLLVILYKLFKPYFLKYDTTLCMTGGLGSGKSLTTVKTAIVLIRKQRFIKYYAYNFFMRIGNFFINIINKKRLRYNLKHQKKKNFKEKKLIKKLKLNKKPLLYSNIPIHFKKHIFSSKREWSVKLTAPMMLCLEQIREYSVVVIDELPQFINQFNWNEQLIQKNVNEWITYFRHYYAGYLLVNAQATADVVVQIRRKLNQAVWCYDFHKYLFGLFYTIRMCDVMLSDEIGTMSTTFIEENTRLHFGLFPPRKTYSTRCYKNRINNIYKKEGKLPKDRWKDIYTNTVLRFVKYVSPLDDTTTEIQKKEQWDKGELIWKN